jgi:hypothetical protein
VADDLRRMQIFPPRAGIRGLAAGDEPAAATGAREWLLI